MATPQNIRTCHKRSSIKESDIGVLKARVAMLKKCRTACESQSASAPIVWQRLSSGYRIVDLQLDRFMQALDFIIVHRRPKYSLSRIKMVYHFNCLTLENVHPYERHIIRENNFCKSEPMCYAVGLFDDALSMKSFINKVFEKMENMTSFVAIQEGTDDIVGVLLSSFFDKYELSFDEKGETLQQVSLLKNYAIVKADYFESLDSEKLACIDIVSVKADHQGRGIATGLLYSCVTRYSNIASACVAEFTSAASQTVARKLEFVAVYELPYENLGLESSQFEVFESCYPENYSIACMAVRLSPPLYQILEYVKEFIKEPPKKVKKGKKRK